MKTSEFTTFKDLNLLTEESRDMVEFIAKKRNVNNYKDKSDIELLSALKEKSRNLTPKKQPKNPKHKISKNLTPIKPIKNLKRKITDNLTLKKSFKNIKSKISKNLTPKKSLENRKSENN